MKRYQASIGYEGYPDGGGGYVAWDEDPDGTWVRHDDVAAHLRTLIAGLRAAARAIDGYECRQPPVDQEDIEDKILTALALADTIERGEG